MQIGIDGNEANVTNRVGTGVYTFELLKQFAQEKELNFQIFLKDNPKTDMPPESSIFKYKIFGPQKFWTQFALPLKLTFGKKPNVFFSPAHYGPRYSKVPYVVTIHDLSYLHFPELFKKEDVLQLTSWSKYSIENSAHVIVPSQSTKNDIVKNYKVSDSKISVTYEGYNKDLFKKKSKQQVETVKKKYKIAGDYVIFVGTIQPRKNIERLIEAFSKIKPKSAKLVIVGRKGWLYDAIFKKSHDLGIQEEVIFTDFVPNEDLPPLISGSKAYINPSLWEGFGIPVVEAQACDVPVAVASTSSLPEIVGESGILFDPDSVESIKIALQKLITNEKFSRELIKKGQENVKRFSWEACAKETLAILTKVASN